MTRDVPCPFLYNRTGCFDSIDGLLSGEDCCEGPLRWRLVLCALGPGALAVRET